MNGETEAADRIEGPVGVAPRILIVDDQIANVELLKRILARAGYEDVEGITDPRDFASTVDAITPDLILLDLHMPEVDGFAILETVSAFLHRDTYLPVLVITADATPETKRKALQLGAKDFLTKPLDVEEVVLRVRNLLETRLLHLELRAQNQSLEHRVLERTRDLEEAYIETFERLALAAEYRDDATGQHIIRVGRTAAAIAESLGLDEATVSLIELSAGLHDVGKIGVPDTILMKPARLTPEEFAIVKTHTTIGANILAGSRSPLLQMAELIARYHHERWDGAGYARVEGAEIPLVARITSVADTFDALIHERPYKPAWPLERALEEIRSERGFQFDPEPVDAFLELHARSTESDVRSAS
jgi:putative two-component system response regulator